MSDYDIRLISAAAVTVLALYRLVKWSRQSGPVMLPGPPADNFLWGSLPTIRDPKDIVPQWTKEYGKTFAVTGFLSMKRLYTLDLRAIAHVLSHPAEFHKPWQSRIGLTAITGPGLVAVEGDVHKRQVSNIITHPVRWSLRYTVSSSERFWYLPCFSHNRKPKC